MAETDTIGQTSSRFRTTRFPGFIGGSTDPSTGNLVPAAQSGNPQSSAGLSINPSGLGGTATPVSGLDNVNAPTIGGLVGDLAGAGATFASTAIGANAGELIAGGAPVGEAIVGGAKQLGSEVADFGSSLFGGGETATAAAAAVPRDPSGLIPTASPAEVNAAFSSAGTGATALPAASTTPSTFGSRLTSPGTLGGAAGAGIGTFVVGLLTGQSPADAAKTGLGSAAGFAIGSAIGGPVGGFIGSAIGSMVGGRVICTELVRQGKMEVGLLGNDIIHSAAYLSEDVINGYHAWAPSIVRVMRRDDFVGKIAVAIVKPLAIWRAKAVSYDMGYTDEPCIEGNVVRVIGESFCWMVGQFSAKYDLFKLYETT